VGLRVGLTGGIGAGKSTVAGLLGELGARVIAADTLARQVVSPGSPALEEIAVAFGPEFLAPGGELDRPRMGRLVFSDAAARHRLEAILHPRIRALFLHTVTTILGAEPGAVVVYDAPVLIEAGAHKEVDRVLVVAADEATQVARLATRDGMSSADALARIRSQMPLAEKLPYAHHVLNGTLPHPRLKARVGELMDEFRRAAGGNFGGQIGR